MAVFLKIIWRAAPAPRGRRLGVSAKRSMSGYPQNVRLSGGDDAKPDGMIVGREGGPAPGNVGGDWPGPCRIERAMPPPTPDGRTGAVAASCVFWIEATEAVF